MRRVKRRKRCRCGGVDVADVFSPQPRRGMIGRNFVLLFGGAAAWLNFFSLSFWSRTLLIIVFCLRDSQTLSLITCSRQATDYMLWSVLGLWVPLRLSIGRGFRHGLPNGISRGVHTLNGLATHLVYSFFSPFSLKKLLKVARGDALVEVMVWLGSFLVLFIRPVEKLLLGFREGCRCLN